MRNSSEPRKRKPGRPVGESTSRDAILDAAKMLFGSQGYEGASLRAIANAAGVDPASIRHFFGDKEGLFVATIANRTAIATRLGEAFAGESDRLGARFAETYLGLWDDDETGPILRAMARTAFNSEHSAALLRDILSTRVTAGMTPDLAAQEEMPLRMLLAGAHLFGIAIARNLAHADPLVSLDRDRLVGIVAPVVQNFLTGPLNVETT